MTELDFLPEWYKQDRRRQSHVRRQCLALGLIFMAMMTFNLTATHRANRAAAELARTEDRRILAETIIHEFNQTTKALNERKARVNLIEQMDSRIDIAAVLAETSHLIDDSIVLRKVELAAEPFLPAGQRNSSRGTAPRTAGRPAGAATEVPLGKVRFHVVLAGVAAGPTEVANLVQRLEESSYFQRVRPSYCGNTKIPIGGKPSNGAGTPGAAGKPQASLDVTEFEITCYVANYKESDE